MRFYKAQPSAGTMAPQINLTYFDLVVGHGPDACFSSVDGHPLSVFQSITAGMCFTAPVVLLCKSVNSVLGCKASQRLQKGRLRKQCCEW